MKKIIFTVILWSWFLGGASYIGYDSSKVGLLGDKLMLYTKALWVADQFNIPLVYTPFMYSTQLRLHEINKGQPTPSLTKVSEVKAWDAINPDRAAIYLISYYFKDPKWQQDLNTFTWKDIIDNEGFLAKLRKHISLVKPFAKLKLPTDRITVAVHVRKGGGVGNPLFAERDDSKPINPKQLYKDKMWPLKFPPESYYINQIKRLSELLNDQPMYVHIFTDDKTPAKIMERFKVAVNKNNIIYGTRAQGNAIDRNVLEDFFAMTQFDCLIRGGSNFTQIIHLIGKFKIVIFIKRANWEGNIMKIDVGTMDKRVQ